MSKIIIGIGALLTVIAAVIAFLTLKNRNEKAAE